MTAVALVTPRQSPGPPFHVDGLVPTFATLRNLVSDEDDRRGCVDALQSFNTALLRDAEPRRHANEDCAANCAANSRPYFCFLRRIWKKEGKSLTPLPVSGHVVAASHAVEAAVRSPVQHL